MTKECHAPSNEKHDRRTLDYGVGRLQFHRWNLHIIRFIGLIVILFGKFHSFLKYSDHLRNNNNQKLGY